MTTQPIRWVMLLRGINVGGHAKLPMADLKSLLASKGASDITTYIQSGNVVFSAACAPDPFLKTMWDHIEANHGFRKTALMVDAQTFQDRAQFPFATDSPKTGHIFFHTGLAKPDLQMIDSLRAPSEEIRITDHATYLHTPDGFGRSKLAAHLESALGTPATARNLATVNALLTMITP
ncbi:MAG: DUF1697 domain-containing protein [Maritimibacter sp.]